MTTSITRTYQWEEERVGGSATKTLNTPEGVLTIKVTKKIVTPKSTTARSGYHGKEKYRHLNPVTGTPKVTFKLELSISNTQPFEQEFELFTKSVISAWMERNGLESDTVSAYVEVLKLQAMLGLNP